MPIGKPLKTLMAQWQSLQYHCYRHDDKQGPDQCLILQWKACRSIFAKPIEDIFTVTVVQNFPYYAGGWRSSISKIISVKCTYKTVT
jgi:hypothetical protein